MMKVISGGAVDLMNVSKEYGMKMKKKKRTKLRKGEDEVSLPVVEVGLAAMDDLTFATDPRMLSGRKKKKQVRLPLPQEKNSNYIETPFEELEPHLPTGRQVET